MITVLIGPPASGKSTLVDHLRKGQVGVFGVRRFFEGQVTQKTALGRAVEPYVLDQTWIPDEVVISGLMSEIDSGRLGDDYILEGVPATEGQARLLDMELERRGLRVGVVVNLSANRNVLVSRASSRLVCQKCDHGSHQVRLDGRGRCVDCGSVPSRRLTDIGASFLRRLAEYDRQYHQLLEYYGAPRLLSIDTSALSAEEVFAFVNAYKEQQVDGVI